MTMIRLIRQHLLLAAFVLLGFHTAHAETVSIANMDVSREAILIEAALKRFLRDDGYTVTGASTEGFVVLLHGMSAQTRQGASVGVVGSATVLKVLRRASTAALLPEGFPQAQEFVGTFTAVMGSPLITLLAPQRLAEMPRKWHRFSVSMSILYSSTRLSGLPRCFEHWSSAPQTMSPCVPQRQEDEPHGSNGIDSCH